MSTRARSTLLLHIALQALILFMMIRLVLLQEKINRLDAKIKQLKAACPMEKVQ